MQPEWISNQWTLRSEHFTGNTGSPTKQKNCVPRGTPQVGWPCLPIRNTRTDVKPTTHSPFLHSQQLEWGTLGTGWAGHDYSVCPPRSWKLVVALHGNEFHLGLDCKISSSGSASRETRWEKIYNGTCWKEFCTWGSQTSRQPPHLPGNVNQLLVVPSLLGSPCKTWSMYLSALS